MSQVRRTFLERLTCLVEVCRRPKKRTGNEGKGIFHPVFGVFAGPNEDSMLFRKSKFWAPDSTAQRVTP